MWFTPKTIPLGDKYILYSKFQENSMFYWENISDFVYFSLLILIIDDEIHLTN